MSESKTKAMTTRDSTTDLSVHEGEAERLIRAAIEKQVPVETMERLLAMRRELRAEFSREQFYRALSNFQSECPIIPKTKRVTVRTQGGSAYAYSYAPLDVIVETVQPILQRYGLSFTTQTRLEKEPLSQIATCTVHHISGHSETSEFRAPIDAAARMNDMQKSASAVTYAKRYAFCNALGILTGDEDDDAQSVESSPRAKRPPVPGRVKESTAKHDCTQKGHDFGGDFICRACGTEDDLPPEMGGGALTRAEPPPPIDEQPAPRSWPQKNRKDTDQAKEHVVHVSSARAELHLKSIKACVAANDTQRWSRVMDAIEKDRKDRLVFGNDMARLRQAKSMAEAILFPDTKGE